jgi:hypothetical protein
LAKIQIVMISKKRRYLMEGGVGGWGVTELEGVGVEWEWNRRVGKDTKIAPKNAPNVGWIRSIPT